MKKKGIRLLKFSVLFAGFSFLYIPILILIIFSFNKSKLVSVWGGFSTVWYTEIWQNQQLLDSLGNSLKVAFAAAFASLVIGTVAGYILERKGIFKGRSLFSGMITAPLVMPDVIIGISMLLMFVGMENLLGWPAGRGLLTIWIAHTTFCSSFVAIIVAARLHETDKFVEEAALDLGCPPFKSFLTVTLPIISPALVSGWLLAFTLSFDDLVISSFVSGPGSSTLPIRIYSSVRLGVKPEINAIATIIITIVMVAALAYGLISILHENKKHKKLPSD